MSDRDSRRWELPPDDVENVVQAGTSPQPGPEQPQPSYSQPPPPANLPRGPGPPGAEPARHDQPLGRVRRAGVLKPAIVAIAVLAALSLGVAVTLVSVRPWDRVTVGPSVSDVVPQPALPQNLAPTGYVASPSLIVASASCISSPSRDAGGNPTSYEPGNVLDGRPDTAWRCDGNGAGQQLRVTFGGTVTINHVGIIPGLAKIDPYDATDRYAQNRRVSVVRYAFDDGRTVDQRLDTSIFNRSLQLISLPHLQSSSVTITILHTVAGSTQNRQAAFDKVAISEVSVS